MQFAHVLRYGDRWLVVVPARRKNGEARVVGDFEGGGTAETHRDALNQIALDFKLGTRRLKKSR